MRRACLVLPLFLLACDGEPPAMPDAGPIEPDAGMVDCSGRPADAPETRGEANGVFDAERNRILVYGGDTAAPIDCMPMYELVDELWAFSLDCNSWERLTTTGGPGIRTRHATTVDTQRGRMLMFGGRTREGFGVYTNYADVWALDLETLAWEQVTTTGAGPMPRSSAVVGYDAAGDRLIVFGGNVSTGGLTLTGVDDTWALDLATGAWTEITVEPRPGPRLYHGGVVMGGELVVFGGTATFDPPYYADTWALDMTTDTWREVSDGAGGPLPRFGAEVFAADGRMIMTMGHDALAMGNRNDVWALDLATSTWTELQPGDELTGEPSGFCDFPPDFTAPQDGAPERRYSFVHVQAEGRGFVFGGKTDCGNINDVWSLGLEGGAWERLRPATGGEACNRTGRTGCTTLCF